ncbi:MAG: hypothetical protein V7K40_07525 [Nostoc sp.]|uniref:hypothetical protein n=1 Tax=Nostoc sp. TaxID=1180 RepID=UPI002FF7D770
METWASLKSNTPFNQIFTDGKVPIKSIVPIIPRDKTSPACYVVDADFLSNQQILVLAERLYQMWQPECTDVQMAVDYIRQGLPLKCDHFCCVTTTDQAVFAAMLDEPTSNDDFDDWENEDDDWENEDDEL